eukprot:5250400-Prymnesium_polylepis.1
MIVLGETTARLGGCAVHDPPETHRRGRGAAGAGRGAGVAAARDSSRHIAWALERWELRRALDSHG